MSSRPVIGIIACNRITGVEPAQSAMTRYVAAAMRYADAAALLVPSLPELMSAAEVAPRLDALMLTGSPSNVAATHYGEGAIGDGPFDERRDRTAFALVDAMLARGRPIFGICRGFQELNVAFGGSLRRDLDTGDVAHHAPDDADLDAMFAHTHGVEVVPGGILARLFGNAHPEVNSVHYQGIARLAPGLRVEATAPDGIVEAFSAKISGAEVLAVQWHPEWHTDANPHAQALFAHFGAVARA